MQTVHIPVLVDEILAWLEPISGGFYVDGTLGDGGHTAEILRASSPGGQVLGVDRDGCAIARARERLRSYGERFTTWQGSFADISTPIHDLDRENRVDGILLDLGVSTLQLLSPERGFSFAADGPLDMRMDAGLPRTAADILNQESEKEIARILWEFGDERASRRIAAHVVETRRSAPIQRSSQLEAIVRKAGVRGRPGHNPATRTFQALRIAVNGELDQLSRFLEACWLLLRPGGRLAILSYHSLEDRIVKEAFRRMSSDCLCPPRTPACVCGWTRRANTLVKKKIRPSDDEVRANPRARSAGLRVAEKVSADA